MFIMKRPLFLMKLAAEEKKKAPGLVVCRTAKRKRPLVCFGWFAVSASFPQRGLAYVTTQPQPLWDHSSSNFHCVTQLKLDTGEKLSSTIFCCLCVSEASVSPDQISTFSNIYRHTSPLLTQYNLILSSAVPTYTDPLPPSTNQ